MSKSKPGPNKKEPLSADELVGYAFFRKIGPLLERLHSVADHPNRELHYDQYIAALLFYFFNPLLTSLRGLQQATELKKVQKALGLPRTGLSTFSDASYAFDAELLVEIIEELSTKAQPLAADSRLRNLKKVLTAVDGSLLPALPRMTWALWKDEEHRAARAHLQFEVIKGIPVKADVTAGQSSEKAVFRVNLEDGRFYVMDRGYAEYALFQEIIDADSSFVGRLRHDAVYEVVEAREIDEAGREAGVIRDQVAWLGHDAIRDHLKQPVRIIEIEYTEGGKTQHLLLATHELEIPADVIALIYRMRWQVELFFRWLKCILGCRHLLSQNPNGVTIQVYGAIIATLLISVWTGLKPTKRTYEMVCLYFQGWADEAELIAHLEKRKAKESNSKKS